MRPRKTVIAAGALALMTGFAAPAARAQTDPAQQPSTGQQPAAGQQAAAGQQPAGKTKNYKDRAEYDLFLKITQTQDPKARLDLLNQWQDKYPQSDYSDDRNIYYRETLAQLAQSDPSVRQKLIDKCEEILKTKPDDFRSNFLVALWGPAVGGATPPADLQTEVQTAAQAVVNGATATFDPSKKPAQVSDADFTKAKNQALGIAHNALAWVATSKKDMATAENEYKESLEANPDQGNISAVYAKMLVDDKKIPEGLFEYARAGEYTGPGPALPEAQRTSVMNYFNKEYQAFHGSMDGADKMMADAKTQAVPPSGMTLTSQQAQAQAQADTLNQRIASDPSFKIWYAIKQSLTGDTGQEFFTKSVKDVEVPGGAEGVKDFSGTVISLDPTDRPTKVVLGVEDPTKPDATLTFSRPLPASALDQIKVGQKIEFSGVVDSYTKDPYMLTFGDPTIPGVQTSVPARRGRARH